VAFRLVQYFFMPSPTMDILEGELEGNPWKTARRR